MKNFTIQVYQILKDWFNEPVVLISLSLFVFVNLIA